MDQQTWVGSALIGMVLMAVVGGFFLTHERVEEEVDLPVSGPAVWDRYHAAKELLSALDVPATSRYGLGSLPTTDTVLVLVMQPAASIVPGDRLVDWVASGGHLMVLVEPEVLPSLATALGSADTGAAEVDEAAGEDVVAVDSGQQKSADTGRRASTDDLMYMREPVGPGIGDSTLLDGESLVGLLARFGLESGNFTVEIPSVEDDDAAEAGGAIAPDETPDDAPDRDTGMTEDGVVEGASHAGWRRPLVAVDVPHRGEPLQVELMLSSRRVHYVHGGDERFESWFGLPDALVGPQAGVPTAVGASQPSMIARSHLGSGTLTVVTDAALLQHDAIGERDAALLWWELVRIDGRSPAAVLMVLQLESDSLWTLIWRRGWPLVISTVLLLLAWAWRRSLRFGPLLPVAVRRRRSLLEHIDGSGRFLWRHGHRQLLLDSARSRVRQRLSIRVPESARLEGEAFVAVVAAATGESPVTVATAFTDVVPDQRRSFFRAMAALQRIGRNA